MIESILKVHWIENRFMKLKRIYVPQKHAVLYHVINMKAFGKYKIYSAKLKAYIFFLINK